MTTLPGFKAPRGGLYSAKNVQPFRVPTDPPLRDDKTCWFEDCGKPLGRLSLLHADPFCSTVCCRRYYDVPAPAPGERGRPRAGS